MIFREHTSWPGSGWIEPIMDQDDPLIHRDVAERIIKAILGFSALVNKQQDQITTLMDSMRETDRQLFLREHPEADRWGDQAEASMEHLMLHGEDQ